MMPQCRPSNFIKQCVNPAVFLGPHENPALCQEHLDELLKCIKDQDLEAEGLRRKKAINE